MFNIEHILNPKNTGDSCFAYSLEGPMRSKFALNDLVVVTNPITIEPCNTIIEKGETGKIIDVDPETEDLTVRLYAQFPDLYCQRNCIHILAHEADQHIKITKNPTSKISIIKVANIGVSLCGLFIIGSLAYDIEFGHIAAVRSAFVKKEHITGSSIPDAPACRPPVIVKHNDLPMPPIDLSSRRNNVIPI